MTDVFLFWLSIMTDAMISYIVYLYVPKLGIVAFWKTPWYGVERESTYIYFNVLSSREFKARANLKLSDIHEQEIGPPKHPFCYII